LDTEKINNTAKYDGFLAITTNTANIDPALVLDHYHHLFQIEHAFSTFKSYLETRPMFHWTDKRIEGHICLCYLAYVLLNHLLQRLKKHKITEKQVRKILSHMQVSHIKQLDEQYYLRSKQDPLENTILTALVIKALTNIIPASKIEDHLR
jgi:transposase